jgi:GNAT superfamily N-acetyltransferase
VLIRSGTPEEAEAVARVHLETWRAAYGHVFPRDRLDDMSSERVAQRAALHRRFPPTVAEIDGRIVGFVSVGASRDEDADGELFAIYVHPDQWGTGVGRALIAAGEQELLALGHRDVVLWVLEDNPRARQFYESAGWTADGAKRPIEVLGVEVPEVRYRKNLNRVECAQQLS